MECNKRILCMSSHMTHALKWKVANCFVLHVGIQNVFKNVSNQRKIGSTMNKMMKDCYCHYQNNVKHLLQQNFIMCKKWFCAY